MECACKIDLEGRILLLAEPKHRRMIALERYRMSRDGGLALEWKCEECERWGYFRRLDRRLLNYYSHGRSAVLAFNRFNARIRRKIQDIQPPECFP
jgi:hypothetical protein